MIAYFENEYKRLVAEGKSFPGFIFFSQESEKGRELAKEYESVIKKMKGLSMTEMTVERLLEFQLAYKNLGDAFQKYCLTYSC